MKSFRWREWSTHFFQINSRRLSFANTFDLSCRIKLRAQKVKEEGDYFQEWTKKFSKCFFCESWAEINPGDLNGKKQFSWMRRSSYNILNKANYKEK